MTGAWAKSWVVKSIGRKDRLKTHIPERRWREKSEIGFEKTEMFFKKFLDQAKIEMK